MNIFYLILGLIGGIAGIVYLTLLAIHIIRNRKTVSWGKFVKVIRQTMRRMKDQNYTPDLIIGCGRGGAIMAAMLSGNLGVVHGRKERHIPFVVCDRLYSWERSAESDRLPMRVTRIVNLPEMDLGQKNVLLTMATINTGETIKTLVEEITKRQGEKTASVKIYAVLKYRHASLTPDFYDIETRELLKMPWEVTKEYNHDSKPPTIS